MIYHRITTLWLLQSPAKRRGKPMASGRCLVMEKGDWTKLPIADFPRPCVISTADVPNKVVQPSTGISQVINHCEYIGTPVLGDDHPTSRRVRGQDDLRAIIVDWTAPNAAICTPQGRTPRVQRGPCCRSGNGMCIQEIDGTHASQGPESARSHRILHFYYYFPLVDCEAFDFLGRIPIWMIIDRVASPDR